MTDKEIIKALQENTSAFGLMPVELREKAKKIGLGQFKIRWCGEWIRPTEAREFDEDYTYRLRPDYTDEPQVIELEIRWDSDGDARIYADSRSILYTSAPAISPKLGYRFAGYRYKNNVLLSVAPVQWNGEGTSTVFPTHAVYRKEA